MMNVSIAPDNQIVLKSECLGKEIEVEFAGFTHKVIEIRDYLNHKKIVLTLEQI